MEMSLSSLIKLATEIGPLGLVVFFWWYDNRRIWNVFEQHKKELAIERAQAAELTKNILEQYRGDMDEQREMYRTNASLCRDFSSVASDLREIVIMNIEKMTRIEESVRQNQFCPVVRMDKKQLFVRQD
jgi:hypothetical protein